MVLFASVAGVELFVLRRMRFGWFMVAMVLVGLLVDVSYLPYTSITERNYDGLGHIYYIDYLAEHLRLRGKSVERIGQRFPAAHHVGIVLGLLMIASSVAFFVRIP